MNIQKLALAAAAISMLGLAGCGATKQDRAMSGAGLGAATGAGIGALTGGSILGGALIGGAAGGAGGYLTDPDDVNLGRPLWKR